MKPRAMAPLSPQSQSLIAAERVLVPESEEVLERVLLRAQAALPRRGTALQYPLPPQEWWLRKGPLFAAAAASVFAAVAAIAALRGNWHGLPTPAPAARVTARPLNSVASDVSSVPLIPVPPPEPTPPPPTPPPPPERKSVPSLASAGERDQLELGLLQRARLAVGRGDFSAALAAISEHERYFPNGQLSEEREALRVKALRGLGKTSAADAAALSFRKRFPRSVLLRRMDGLVGSP